MVWRKGAVAVIACILLLITASFSLPVRNAETFLHHLYKRHHGRFRTNLFFTQKTEKYRNDSLVSTETWYETMVYPRHFRIDFGNREDGSCVIFRNDSVYNFHNRQLTHSSVDTNDLLFLLGGMYFEDSFANVLSRFAAMHFDVRKYHYTTWQGYSTIVIGAAHDSEQVNQLWFDKAHGTLVRFIKYDKGTKREGIFSGHTGRKNGWCETMVIFYVNNKLRQKESYTNIYENIQI